MTRGERALFRRCLSALGFYADPGTYEGLRMVYDPPCGDFARDFGRTDRGRRPGRRARRALALRERLGDDDACADRLILALAFYGQPQAYAAILFSAEPQRSRPPFARDFGETWMGQKPGKRARDVLLGVVEGD